MSGKEFLLEEKSKKRGGGINFFLSAKAYKSLYSYFFNSD